MKFTLLISSAALLAVVSGQAIVSITSPLSGSKLKAGSEAVISWVNPTVPKISTITLARGPSTALQPVTTIATDVDTAAGKYVWKIPYEIENGNEYAFELGTSPDLAFAGPFSIEGGVGGTLPPSNATASTPVAPGAPPAAAPSNPAAAPAPSSAGSPSGHASPPIAAASNAKAPAAGSSPTGSSASQLTSTSGKCMAVVAGSVIIASQFF